MKHILPFEESIAKKGAILIWCESVSVIAQEDIVLFDSLETNYMTKVLAKTPRIKRLIKQRFYNTIRQDFSKVPLWIHNEIDLVVFLQRSDVVLHLHNFYLHDIEKNLDLINKLKAVVVPSHALKKSLIELGVNPEKLIILRNGIESAIEIDRWQERPVDYTFCGRLDLNKGFGEVYDLLINKQIKRTTSIRVIVAKTPFLQSELFVNLIKLILLKVKFRNHLTIYSHMTHQDVIKCFEQTKYLLVPTRKNEAFGMVALEGLARGAVVADSGVGGLKEIVPYSTFFMDKGAYNYEKFDFRLHNIIRVEPSFFKEFLWNSISNEYKNLSEKII